MTVEYNPFNSAEVDHHGPVLARLRAEAPVAELLPGVFYVSRFEDVVEVCRQPDLFKQGGLSPMDDHQRSEDQRHLGETDPPLHTRVRKVLASVLSPTKIRPFEPFVGDVCRQLVGSFASRGSADLIEDLGAPLPAIVVGHIAGTPDDLRPYLRQYGTDYALVHGDPTSVEGQSAAVRMDKFNQRVLGLIHERRAMVSRPPDVLSDLIEAVDDQGNPLSDEKILVHLGGDLLVGGSETTTHLIGNLFFELLRTPGAYERVRDDRSLVPVAVEEALRVRSPVHVLFRRPVEDTVIAGVKVPAGATVAVGYASANHDEAVFPHPEVFDLDRAEVTKRHLAFGWGIHLCVGAPLARMEVSAALNAVLDRIPHMELAPGFEYQRVEFFMMQGPRRLDVVFDPVS